MLALLGVANSTNRTQSTLSRQTPLRSPSLIRQIAKPSFERVPVPVRLHRRPLSQKLSPKKGFEFGRRGRERRTSHQRDRIALINYTIDIRRRRTCTREEERSLLGKAFRKCGFLKLLIKCSRTSASEPMCCTMKRIWSAAVIVLFFYKGLFAAPLDAWQWHNPPLYGITYGNGRLVAVGHGGTVMHSTNAGET